MACTSYWPFFLSALEYYKFHLFKNQSYDSILIESLIFLDSKLRLAQFTLSGTTG